MKKNLNLPIPENLIDMPIMSFDVVSFSDGFTNYIVPESCIIDFSYNAEKYTRDNLQTIYYELKNKSITDFFGKSIEGKPIKLKMLGRFEDYPIPWDITEDFVRGKISFRLPEKYASK